MDRTCSGTSYRCVIGLGCGEFGGEVDLELFVTLLGLFLSRFCVVAYT